MMDENQIAFVKLLLNTIPIEELASMASDESNGLKTQVFTCVIRDVVFREIVVGHALITLSFGAEEQINRFKQIVMSHEK